MEAILKIVVFTRGTPDTAAKVEADSSGSVGWGDADLVVNPWDEFALEEAIVQAEATGSTTAVVALGGEQDASALKHGLAMGIHEAALVDDPGLNVTDGLAYAITAAAAVHRFSEVGLVLFGRESVDVGTDQHIVQTARKLGWPVITNVSKIVSLDGANHTIRVARLLEQGKQTVTAPLPVVLSVTKEINEPRFPSFMGIRKAAKASIPRWTLADLGVALPAIPITATGYRNLPARENQLELLTGTPQEMARQLIDRLIEEKVL
jgi:electron transfer flavoprotein beta subunit